MAKRKINQLADYLFEYYNSHEEDLLDIINTLNMPFDEENEDFKEFALNKSLTSLMGIALIINSNIDLYAPLDDVLRNSIKKKDFEACRKILEQYFYHVFIEVSCKWVDFPTKLSRNILVPVRNTLGDLIYAVLAAFRCEGKHEAEINTMYKTFVPLNDIEQTKYDRVEVADVFPILSLIENESLITYDFIENYDFKIKYLKAKYIKNEELSLCNVIVNKAKGYGINEDNIADLYSYLEDPSSVELPFNFDDVDIEELKELVDADFDIIRMRYYGVDVDEFLENILNDNQDIQA